MLANLGFNPMNNGESIIINVPVLTEERRRELSKVAKSAAYHAKVSIRNARKEANNEIKKIYHSYAEVIRFDIDKNKRVEGGKELALFNTLGLLELAIYKSNPRHTGGASSLFGLNYLDVVNIQFE